MEVVAEMTHDELTPAEREAFEKLPRERVPSRILEERTVRALKERGLVRTGPAWGTSIRPWMAAAAIAASLALFAAGMLVGQWMGARQAVDAMAAVYPEGPQRAAARVQASGSEYAAALGQLVEASGSADSEQIAQAREVALAAFWAAAAEIVRLAPDDPLAARILQELEREERPQAGGGGGARTVIWF
jgi:hypothetical protein